ncbi:MAG: cytochrome c [Candidatus Promineifilaceae bacterium]
MRKLVILGTLLLLIACGAQPEGETAVPTETANNSSESSGMGMGGMGMGGGMMARHSAPIPDEYVDLSSPVAATEESLTRGGDLFTTYCATCHGDGGMGDGPAAANLNPAPVAIAHTSQMLGDNYLYWRISAGGQGDPFNSAMPAWGAALSEQDRWDLINYIRALGSGTAPNMGGMMGGTAYDPNAEATRQADMLVQAVTQSVLTQAEADLFAEIHTELETNMTRGMQMQGNMGQMQEVLLAQLVDLGTISQEQADQFNDIHTRLLEAGLMQ